MVIGKRGHVEVNGLIGDFPTACVVESTGDLGQLPQTARLGVISQTTQPTEKVLALVETTEGARLVVNLHDFPLGESMNDARVEIFMHDVGDGVILPQGRPLTGEGA